MKNFDLQQYLANIIFVARADGVLSSSEKSVLDEIHSQLKAKKKHIKEAENLASGSSFALQPVGRFSDRVRNVEDMVYLAIADGDFADSEKRTIINFAKQIGVTQDQINEILSEAKSRIEENSDTSICPSCQKDIPSSSRFCPKCGSRIEQSEKSPGIKLEFDYPSQGISIEFPESSSANFHGALATARKAVGFQECERSKKKWFLATWPSSAITETIELVENLKGSRNRKVFVDGEAKTWDEVFGFLRCYQKRQQAYRPIEYCFGVDENQINIWGCKQINMDWTSWARWFSYGQFRKKDVFVFNRERIRHELETNLYKARFCPCLRFQLVDKALELLPNEVRVSDRDGWKYSQNHEEVPNSIKVVQKIREEGFTYTNEFYADGVRPIGYTVGLDILKKALRMCAITDVTVPQLTA